MSKLKDLLLSVLLPRKMYRHHTNKVIYSALIFVLSTFLILASVNISTKRFMKKTIDTINFDDYRLLENQKLDMPKYEIAESNSGGYYLDVKEATNEPDTFKGVYKFDLEHKTNGNKVEVTVVIDEECDFYKSDNPDLSIDKNLFDLDGYINQRTSSKDDKIYLLYIFTKKSFIYLYNLGQVKDKNGNLVDSSNMTYNGYERDSSGNYKYYLPKDDSELVKNSFGGYDTSLWTREVSMDATYESSEQDVTISAKKRLKGVYKYYLPKDDSEVNDINSWSLEVNEGETKTLEDGKVLKATKRYYLTIRNAIYNGEYIYSAIRVDDINDSTNFSTNTDYLSVLKKHFDVMLDADTKMQKSVYAIFAALINIIFPIVWVLITWLVSRKFVMNKFREYYAICAISYITTSFIGFILGFFIRFDSLMLILLAIELIYYIFVTFRINTDPNLLNPKDDEKNKKDDDDHQEPKEEKPNITFTKIKSDDAYRVE